jgi:hypothetical protein
MEHEQFDDLARSLGGEDGTRRTLLRLVVGGALGALAARLGLAEITAAKPKRPKLKLKLKDRHAHHPATKSQTHPQQSGGTQTEGRHQNERKNRPAAGFRCPAAARCHVIQQDTAAAEVDVQSCAGKSGARDLCDTAMHSRDFRTLVKHLRATGFSLARDPRPTIDFYKVRGKGTRAEDIFVLRFVKRSTGQEALLRYGEAPHGEHVATYAFIQKDDLPISLLAVDDNGKMTKTPVGENAQSGQRRAPSRRAGRSAGVARSNPDNPYDGQADELCSECPLVCKTLGSMECGLLILLLTRGNKEAAATLGPLCAKPAEAGCKPYCNSMIGPLLEDDSKNCGACGHGCAGQERCCAGQCAQCCSGERPCPNGTCVAEDECCPDAIPPSCGECEERVCENGDYVCRCQDECNCPPGKPFNRELCICGECVARCNPETGMFDQIGCEAGEACIRGQCTRICPPNDYPKATQVCCGGNEWGMDCICLLPGTPCRPGGEVGCDFRP